MIEALASSIVLAAISALTWLAYKHPEAYRDILLNIVVIYGALLFGAIAWNTALSAASLALFKFITSEKQPEAATGISSLTIPWLLLGLAILLVPYLRFLLTLEKLTAKKSSP